MPDLLGAIVVSACLGALIGLIRQWSDQQDPKHETDFGGVRTYTLWSLFGCLSAYGSEAHIAAIMPIALLVVGGYLTVVQLRAKGSPSPGQTSFVSALLAFLVGALVDWDHTQAAVVVAALTMVMLGIKGPVHAWTKKFTVQDIHSTLQFVAITGVVLPLVPQQAMGPFAAFNPFTTWLMVVLISGIGFAGYIAMRLLGPRAGIFATSIFGGVASSTAATLAFSRASREDVENSANYAFAVVVACSVMLPRMLVAVTVVNPELLRPLLPLLLMVLPAAGYGLWLWRRRPTKVSELPARHIGNPLRLFTAVKFALLYTLIAFLVKASTALGWQRGLFPLSFVSGLTDVDAISLTLASNVSSGATSVDLASRAIVIAAVANSVLKAGLAIGLGTPLLRRHVGMVLGLTALTGVIIVFFMSI